MENARIINRIKHRTFKFSVWFLGVFGIFSFLILLLSFTDIPYYAYYWLGTSNAELNKNPDVIAVLGGSGMPSPDGLIRTYYAAEYALKYKEAKIIIALPSNENGSLKQLNLMAHELIIRGVDSSRITYEPLGFNTHSQAVNIASRFKEKSQLSLLIITSPEHMYRSIKTFKKTGFDNVGGIPAFEKPIDEEKVKDKENTKDTRVKNLSLRYNMWSYLNYELIVLREYSAISYYKIKGWL
jgi:uncharacterized SAM-binding protein YcdF (DUF218 family)